MLPPWLKIIKETLHDNSLFQVIREKDSVNKWLGRDRRMQNRTPRDLAERFRAGEIGRKVAGIANNVTEYTYPVYWPDQKGDPEAIGSCVLVVIGEAKFLFSASHVLKGIYEREVRVAAGDSLAVVRGEVTGLFREGAAISSDGDDIDLGAIRLKGDSWDQAPISGFAKLEDMDIRPGAATRDCFCLAGYPASKQRNCLVGNDLNASLFRVAGVECKEDTYKACRRNPEVSLMIGFDKKRIWGPHGMLSAPDVYGMSGSGIWRIGPAINDVRTRPLLSGIAVEWHRSGSAKYILGTRVHLIIEALANRYPIVRDSLIIAIPLEDEKEKDML
jgi:hypothetical protein